MKSHVIPVLFEVSAEGHGEFDAAVRLARILSDATLVPRGNDATRIESWFLPNHPFADGSDHETVVLVLPLNLDQPQRDEKWHEPRHVQRNVDTFLSTLKRWL